MNFSPPTKDTFDDQPIASLLERHGAHREELLMRTSHWTTRDGRRIAVTALEDTHLLAALRMGLRAEHRRQRDAALDTLGHACCGDDGTQYLGELQFDEAMAKAHSPSHLRSALARNPRYAPLLTEARRRGLSLLRRAPSRGH